MSEGDARRIGDLEWRLAAAQQTIEALLTGQIDAVVDPASRAPIMLSEAQAALRVSEIRLRVERDRGQRYLDTATLGR